MTTCAFRAVAGVLLFTLCFAHAATNLPPRCELTFHEDAQGVSARLLDLTTETVWADGPYCYSVSLTNGTVAQGLQHVSIDRRGEELVVRGVLKGAPVQVTQRVLITQDRQSLQEQITVENLGREPLIIEDVRFGFTRELDATTERWHWVAVPYRRQVDGKLHDYTSADLREGKFSNSDWRNDGAVAGQEVCDTNTLRSEAWVWTDGNAGLLIAKYAESMIEYSVASVLEDGAAPRLCFGGAGLSLYGEPRAATHIPAGAKVTFGATHYTLFRGDWPRGYELYRDFLNAQGHGLPADYDPPLNWNALFDVGWYHSDRTQLLAHYTRDALLREAKKAREAGCDLLYLDPGWEICEGTTLWDEERLGNVSDFVAELRAKFNLGLGYRTIGRVYRDEFPVEWHMRRKGDTGPYERGYLNREPAPQQVPLRTTDGRPNLALLPQAKASASSVLPGYPEKHTVAHLNDGWYNNSASWIPEIEPSWVEVDLGAEYVISEIAVGSEHQPAYHDRLLREFSIQARRRTTEEWQQLLQYNGPPVSTTRRFQFEPILARQVRMCVEKGERGQVRIDEIEIYEAPSRTNSSKQIQPERKPAPRPAKGSQQINFWEVCTQSPEWQKEKLKRILAITGAGVSFMMFDEFDWRGPCYDGNHGHPVPSTPEGHARAVYGLIEQVRDRHPEVLVEAHDPVWPWAARYLPSYWHQGFTKNRYQENWGFEFMWHPIEDLKSGRALCLYYYNLGCEIPLYDHITMESDNDACLSFWWYASTVRHLGIGGKKGLNSANENETRFQAYKKAVAEYNRLRPYYARGRFVGLDESAHLHLHPSERSAVLNVFNLSDKPARRKIRITAAQLGWHRIGKPRVTGARARVRGDALLLEIELPAMSPGLAEIQSVPDMAGRHLPLAEPPPHTPASAQPGSDR